MCVCCFIFLQDVRWSWHSSTLLPSHPEMSVFSRRSMEPLIPCSSLILWTDPGWFWQQIYLFKGYSLGYIVWLNMFSCGLYNIVGHFQNIPSWDEPSKYYSKKLWEDCTFALQTLVPWVEINESRSYKTVNIQTLNHKLVRHYCKNFHSTFTQKMCAVPFWNDLLISRTGKTGQDGSGMLKCNTQSINTSTH